MERHEQQDRGSQQVEIIRKHFEAIKLDDKSKKMESGRGNGITQDMEINGFLCPNHHYSHYNDQEPK